MPEDSAAGLEEVLDQLADYTLNTHNYQTIHNALNAESSIKLDVVNKLLSICIRSLKEDMKYTVNTLNIILSVIKKVNDGQCVPVPDLVPSALAVLHLLQTTALFSKVEALKILCFDIVISYPDETLISVAVNQTTEFMELFSSYCHQRIPIDLRLQPIHLVAKLLKILPPDKKRQFVKQGVSVWFSKIVPTIVLYINSPNAKADVPIEAIEMLTEELVYIDYIDNPQWQIVLECIYTPQRYPAIMRGLLEKDNPVWCRLWVVFIKLLKNQITKVSNSVGSPINSMLPVVEMAFKMNAKNRCRAFSCWNVLIDNFSTETSDLYINKRIKLLIIPLSSNNAKVVETALAKLYTWWHLIVKFNTKLEKVAAIALIPFLYFCFGKPNNDKPILIPGTLSDELKMKCIEALVEIFGHSDHCKCIVTLPRLDGKLITQKLLVSHWKDWMHAIDNIIKITAESNLADKKSCIKCIWYSLLATLCNMTDSKLKRDLYHEVFSFLDNICLNVKNEIADLMLHILIPTLYDKNLRIASFKTELDEPPIEQRIICMLHKLPKDVLAVRPVAINSLRNVTDYFVQENSLAIITVDSIIKEVPTKGFLIWTALAESICELEYVENTKVLRKMLLCPVEAVDSLSNETETMSTWIELYNFVVLEYPNINDDIMSRLSSYSDSKLRKDFILRISIAMLKRKVKENENKGITYNEELNLLFKISNVYDFTEWINIDGNLEIIIHVMIDVFNKLMKVDDIESVKKVLAILNIVLKHELQQSMLEESNVLCNILEDVFKTMKVTLKMEKYSGCKIETINDIQEVVTKLLLKLEPYQSKDKILNITTLIQSLNVNTETNIKKIESNTNTTNNVKFTEPNKKTSTKKVKKKETTIVNTVMDHGEEYVVVKSNWKFNPRKLTDNQKEKFQRKREDIPALYQDLSQSQDEFKLCTWKTDSQDTSSTSKSTSISVNEDVSVILKNMPNSDIVPTILENMRPHNENSSKTPSCESKIEENDKVTMHNKNIVNTPTVKETKSPRMALKDRVFRNVRNLIEKSNVTNGNTSLGCEVIESDPQTPTTKRSEDINTLINSAPPKISADRPSRQKRKPKKFDDLQLFGLKKRRQSSGQLDSPTNIDVLESQENDNIEKKSCLTDNLAKETTVEIADDIPLLPKNIESARTSINEVTKEQDNKQPVTPNEVQHIDYDVPDVNIIMNTGENVENLKQIQNSSMEDFKDEVATPKPKNRDSKELENSKASVKKSCSKKSRIEKELAIDTVEGHPLLNSNTEKRVTRKRLSNTPNARKSMSEKINKNKPDSKFSKIDGKSKDKENVQIRREDTLSSEDTPLSQDVIESSQDSTITTISVKSTLSSKKVPVVLIDHLKIDPKPLDIDTQDLMDTSDDVQSDVQNADKDDTELPRNKTAVDDSTFIDLTANMDTEPISQNVELHDVIVLTDESEIAKIDSNNVGPESQEIAEADTQSMDPSVISEAKGNRVSVISDDAKDDNPINVEIQSTDDILISKDDTLPTDQIEEKENSKFSPLLDEEQRKKDFLNNTIEISPIKTLSPVGDKASALETSNDYVVIKLKSPVQSNGEPFEKCDSPEIFTEEQRISPDKRDLSPPREEVTVSNSSPSSSLSLKKNRPQVRAGGRAAQMLGLCVPNRLQTIMVPDKNTENEDKKNTPINTSARRNLRMLYGQTAENNEATDENEENENFLKFKRSLPSTDCSPSGPILKRKLAEITDDATVSPASKRKRVSFHDPPVSTTICVKKYIEPCGVRSPQNSAIKRQERQLRSQIATKSPKRLDSLFKLDTALTKTIESFVNEPALNTNEDTEMSSLEPTPIVEVVTTTELNNTDPICTELIDCRDSIENIALKLSSPTMKALLVKEFEGKVDTVGDLAKMTELEVNRLCIKAPKVQVARTVLNEYALTIKQASEEITPTLEQAMSETISPTVPEMVPDLQSKEVQTNEILVDNIGIQTEVAVAVDRGMQSDELLTVDSSAQTDESGSKTTLDLVKLCFEREDFTEQLCDEADETFKMKIADGLPLNTLTDVLLNKMSSSNSKEVLNRVIDQISTNSKSGDTKVLLKEYMCEKFESKDLILFCSEILKMAYNKII